jgi:hypothetical protein
MPKRHYIRLYKVLQHSKLLKLQIQVLFVSTFVDWVLMPYIAKLEGTYLPVMMISLFMLIGASDGFVQPLFKKSQDIQHLSFCRTSGSGTDHELQCLEP